jgi:hypothetical protein
MFSTGGKKIGGSIVPFLNISFEDAIEVLTYAILSVRQMITKFAIALGTVRSRKVVALARAALAESHVCRKRNEFGLDSKITCKTTIEQSMAKKGKEGTNRIRRLRRSRQHTAGSCRRPSLPGGISFRPCTRTGSRSFLASALFLRRKQGTMLAKPMGLRGSEDIQRSTNRTELIDFF